MNILRTGLFLFIILLLMPSTMADDGVSFTTTEHSFEGHSETMVITGEFAVTDAIELSLLIKPAESDNRRHSMMSEYNNEMGIKIYELVEYVDADNNGYSTDDTVLSKFKLNSDNLNDVSVKNVDGDTIFSIESVENGVFNMDIEINKYENIPVAFKWSYDINYPFVSNVSNLAVIHELDQGSMMSMMDGSNMNNHQNMMSDNHKNLPMMFSWDNSVNVDGSDIEITPEIGEDFILSFPNGKNILYDPKIQLDPTDISRVDSLLAGLLGGDFSMLTPQPQSLIMGLVGIATIFTTGLVLDKKQKGVF